MKALFLLTGALAVGPLLAVSAQDSGNCPASKAKASLAANDHDDVNTIVETAKAAGVFNTLLTAARAADLVDALNGEGPLTVFAPTDEAFAKLPEGTVANLLKPENKAALRRVLMYHVVAGDVRAAAVVKLSGAATLSGQRVDIRVGVEGAEKGQVFVDGAQVVRTDITAANGVIHVIDSVLLPTQKNLAEVAVGAGTFNTLVAAAKAAGLVEALTGDTPLTVFAPTDAAFAKLPKGTVESLLLPENKEQLASILKYHIVAGRVYSTEAAKLTEALTLQGSHAPIVVNDKGVTIAGAMITAFDIEATNGVIHVLDSVMMPR